MKVLPSALLFFCLVKFISTVVYRGSYKAFLAVSMSELNKIQNTISNLSRAVPQIVASSCLTRKDLKWETVTSR